MYDPDGDYGRTGSASPAATVRERSVMPPGRQSFCARCGYELTPYTFVAIEGLVFCTRCTEDHEADCLATFHFLGNNSWHAILIDHNALLWLAPSDDKWKATSLHNIHHQMAFERQYGK